MNETKIDWAEMSWNPVTGCRHGCPYCYARRTAHRFDAGLEDSAAVGVLHDAPFRGQDGAGHLGFYGAPLGAGADCQKLTHSYLSSNAIHPAGSGHGTVVKMVFPRLCPDGLPDSGQQLCVVRAAAQQVAQVAPGFAGKAGA